MRRAARTAVLLAVPIAIATAGPANAGHTHRPAVRCGDTITRDTRLTRDLVNCPGTALTVAADNVTLDLAGHLVDGVNAPGSDGIAVDGHAGVTIEHGTVRDFRVNGVTLSAAPQSRVRGLAIRQIGAGGQEGEDVSAGIFVDGSDGVRLTSNRISNDVQAYQADGIVVLRSAGVEVARNDTRRNAWNGLVLVDSPDGRILGNHTSDNVNSGILVVTSPSVVIAGNSASGHPNPDTGGIVLLAVEDGHVVGNRLRDNTTGISVENSTTSTKVARNRIDGGGDGIALLDSDDNRVVGNRARGTEGVGVLLDSFGIEGFDGSDGNTVARNVATGNGFAGLLVDGDSGANRLDGNIAARNAGDGIHVVTPGNRLTANGAFSNSGHGIDAAAGTVDGGANRAFGNALSPQCAGVACG